MLRNAVLIIPTKLHDVTVQTLPNSGISRDSCNRSWIRSNTMCSLLKLYNRVTRYPFKSVLCSTVCSSFYPLTNPPQTYQQLSYKQL